MFSLLAVLGQVIPKGTESPFFAVRLRWCWAWNPITRAAMPALWHQTLPMQNATAGVYHQLTPQPSRCRGIHWWVTWMTRGGRDDTSDAVVGQNVKQWMWCRERRASEEEGCEWCLLNIWSKRAWQVMMGTREGGTEEEPQRNLVKILFHHYINRPRPVFHLKHCRYLLWEEIIDFDVWFYVVS